MVTRRIISTSVILSLLFALMLPMGTLAHGCHGDPTTEQVASQPDEHHHDGHDHDGDHHGKAHGNSYDRHDGHHPTLATTVADTTEASPLHHPTFCCTDSRQAIVERVDTACLSAPLQLTLVITSAAASGMLPLDVLVGPRIIDDYKIGSSPPQVAAADRYTYLHISVLLV